MFFFSSLIISFILYSSYMITPTDCIRDKPPTVPPTNGREKPTDIQKTLIPPPPKNDGSNLQIGTPVPPPSQPVVLPFEGTAQPSKTPAADSSDYYTGEAIRVPTKTKTKDKFVRLKNYDDDDNETDDDEGMYEIEISDDNETQEIEPTPKPKKTIIKKIKSKFKEATNENSLLGMLLQNGTFMSSMRAGGATFGTLFSVCMMFVILKAIKTL